ncbi:hypothetical protein JTE90_010889 [Oedothorax gibbosus]|uniref:Uncharacterized protein n=1 Tax=Oedothorax gibbosus TaxID=931172 RepID=A0AAV6UFY0_9ARAC|nr:hypothetical protein JTE90_010889 [Oedothorax gibbosus]
MFSESRENGPGTTMDMGYSNGNRNQQWYSETLESLAEACRRTPRGRLQTCIRNELVKRCRYSMLQDRFTTTTSEGNWGSHRRTEHDNYGYGQDGYGRNYEPRRRNFFHGGGRRQPQDDFVVMRRPTFYTSDAGGYHTSRGGGSYGGDEADEEDFHSYSDGESERYK